MSIGLTIDVGPVRKYARRIQRFGKGIRDFTPAFEEAEQVYEVMVAAQFDSQGSRGGSSWAPLSPRYAAYKARVRPGKPILVFDGQLRAAATTKGATGSVRIISKNEAKFGVNLPHAAPQQYGTGNMPARPWLVVTPDDTREFTRALHRFAVAAIQRG